MAKVDVIVPIYNVGNYLERNLNSLVNQTYKDIRILCVNDGSTDNSQAIVDCFAKNDERVLSFQKSNGGLSDARNYGLQYVESEYVMFIDSDDFCELNMIETALKCIEDNSANMAVFGYNQYYIETNKKEEIKLDIPEGIYILDKNPEILALTPNCAWNKIYKTSLFVENNIRYPFGYRYEDLGTTAKLMFIANRIAYINKPLYNYLIDRPNNITQQVDNKLYHVLDMIEEIVKFYKEHNAFDKYYDELYYLFERNIITTLRKLVGLNDNKFFFKFIDCVFKFKRRYFKRKSKKYNTRKDKGDFIYTKSFFIKIYYIYKNISNKL